MCGRFARSTDKDDLQNRFGFDDPQVVLLEPRYNIPPSQVHLFVVVEGDQRVLKMMVALSNIVPACKVQQNLFVRFDNSKQKKLMDVIDRINGQWGRDTVKFGFWI
jgi:putative SOS response-associated peptidase YedK